MIKLILISSHNTITQALSLPDGDESTSPPVPVIPFSLCWPCEPQASAVARWDLPLGDLRASKVCWISGLSNAYFGQHSKCHINSTFDHLYSLSLLLMDSVLMLLLKKQKKRWTQSFFHLYRITQGRNPHTCPPLGPPPVHLTLFHFCWPEWH